MRSLYWKIFVSFWLATIMIILTTAWVTGQIAQKSSIPARERVFMDSYANAAVATFESGHHEALVKWLKQISVSRHLALFLLTNQGEIVSAETEIPDSVKRISQALTTDDLDDGILRSGKLIVSHEILTPSGIAYRLAAVSPRPISHFVEIPWAGLTIRLSIAIFFSGLICYLLSIYLTKPLRLLRSAAESIGTGKLNTRVGRPRGHGHDEIAELSDEFDRMAEQLESMVKSKERLLQDISHELRSPLARLNIALELARQKTGNQASKEFDRMELECQRLNDLIAEILEFARQNQAMDQLQIEQVDLVALLQQLVDDANYEANSTEPRVLLMFENGITVPGDKKLLSRAIENILRNAMKYSPADKSIAVELSRCGDTHLLISISDQGPGIPEHQLKKIFNPFYRVDSSRTKQTGGYGLGLAIAQQVVLRHQGQIEASNLASGGLKVSISLPMA